MILSDVKNYVKTRQQASLSDISLHFDVDTEVARGLLEFWINKGRIKKYGNELVCGSACSCSQKDSSELYEWNPQLGNISIEIKG